MRLLFLTLMVNQVMFGDELSQLVKDNLHLDFTGSTEENGANCKIVEQNVFLCRGTSR